MPPSLSRLARGPTAAGKPVTAKVLGREFGIEVFLADPLIRLRESRHRGYHDELSLLRSSAAVSVGLALATAS